LGTGDATGNCQLNELRACIGLLDGGCSTAAARRRPGAAGLGPPLVRGAITADGGAGAGTAADRNVVLAIDWPPAR
jgi:hypothetical protein